MHRTVTTDRTDHRSFWMLAVTQFLGAFNDNAFKQFLIVLALHLTATGHITLSWWPKDPQSIILATFALPFVVFALVGGYMADRFPKTRVIVVMKALEVLIMTLGMGALWVGTRDVHASVLLSIGVLFLMATHSAFFGPAKYGSLPELVASDRLIQANGIINMSTNLAIILGTALPLFDTLVEYHQPFHRASLVFVAVAAVGWVVSLGIRTRPAANPGQRFTTQHLLVPVHAWRELRHVWRDRELFLALMLQSWFYLVGAAAILAINIYGKEVLGETDAGTSLLPFLAGGVAVGSLLVGTITGPRVELGVVSVGVVGMAAGLAATGWMTPGFWGTGWGLAASGVFGGIFIVPLASFIQARPPPAELGRVLGLSELLNFTFIFAAAGVYAVLANGLDLGPASLLAALGLLTVGGFLAFLPISPPTAARMALWLYLRLAYRLRILHLDRIPPRGGVLLVANHISYIDPLMIGIALPRFVRFLIHRSFLEVPVVGPFSRLMRAIPIAESDGPRALLRSLHEAAQHVADGEVACIFAEGGISRTGNLRPFSKGLERIARRAEAPIVPVFLDRLWGSVFSFQGGRSLRKLPARLRYPVTVAIGAPLPPHTPVHEVRQALEELGAEAFACRKEHGVTLATRFLRVAARTPWRLAAVDHARRPIRYFRLLAGVLLLRGLLRRRLAPDEQHVGILLPPSQGGLLANLAVAVAGRIAVNLNFTVGKEALDAALQQCRIRTVITAEPFLKKIAVGDLPGPLDLETLLREAGFAARLKAFAMALLPGFVLARLSGVPQDPDQVATVIFSSGSTGRPKGVCLSHHNILSNAQCLGQVFDVTKRDRVVGVLPLFHSFGYTATVWFPVLSGFAALYHPSPLDAAGIAAIIREHGGSIFVSTPTFFASYLKRWQPEDVRTLRIVVSGAEKLKESLLAAWQERFGHPILQGYGCTELSPAVAVNLPDVRVRDFTQVSHKPGTIGHPLPGVAVKIVDPERFTPLPPGQDGLLLVKGPGVMVGYLDQPELTAEAIRDGWYATGDIARRDEDGFITITDRQSRFAKIGGEMVPHLLVEEAIQKIVDHHTARGEQTEETPQVAVTSLPDAARGEKLVVLHTAADLATEAIIAGLREVGLPNLWIPRPDAIHVVPEIPRLGSGKQDLKSVREMAREREGESERGKSG